MGDSIVWLLWTQWVLDNFNRLQYREGPVNVKPPILRVKDGGFMKVLWSAVAERSGDTAFVFARTRVRCFAGVMQTGAWAVVGCYWLADIATQSGVAAALCHRTP